MIYTTIYCTIKLEISAASKCNIKKVALTQQIQNFIAFIQDSVNEQILCQIDTIYLGDISIANRKSLRQLLDFITQTTNKLANLTTLYFGSYEKQAICTDFALPEGMNWLTHLFFDNIYAKLTLPTDMESLISLTYKYVQDLKTLETLKTLILRINLMSSNPSALLLLSLLQCPRQ